MSGNSICGITTGSIVSISRPNHITVIRGGVPSGVQAGFQLLLIEVAAPTHVPAGTYTSVMARVRRGGARG
jgi:hypothetical protein